MRMMGGQSDSPRMMQVRAKMMKAMADIVMKYEEDDGEFAVTDGWLDGGST